MRNNGRFHKHGLISSCKDIHNHRNDIIDGEGS